MCAAIIQRCECLNCIPSSRINNLAETHRRQSMSRGLHEIAVQGVLSMWYSGDVRKTDGIFIAMPHTDGNIDVLTEYYIYIMPQIIIAVHIHIFIWCHIKLKLEFCGCQEHPTWSVSQYISMLYREDCRKVSKWDINPLCAKFFRGT